MSLYEQVVVAVAATALLGAGDGNNAASAGDPAPRDVWYAYEADGQRYGFEHVTVTTRDDGNFAYRVESKLLLDFLGQRQEVTRNGTFIVTPALDPVSLTQEGKQQSGTTHTTGRVEGDDLVLVYEREGLRRERRMKSAERPLFLPCLDDWLHGQAGQNKAVRRRIIDDSSLESDDAECTRKDGGGDGAIWDVNLGPEAGQGTIVLDADGIRREATFRVPKLHLLRVSAAEATNIKHRVYQGRELLMFPVDRPIGPVQRLTSLTVRLRWEGAGFEQLRLDDERQKVVETSKNDGLTQFLVKIQTVADQNTATTWPIRGDEFRQYLGEDRYIKPRDPAVARLARTWIGEEKTAWGAVRALSAGVFKYMQGGSLIVETLDAPEIVQCKQGKCSEFSILFASAARSVGIPTRIVLGMRILNGSWVGHMWNEAYVGSWVTVDSTTDEVGNAPALLKLVDSESVQGTQPQRWAATDALRVAVEDSAPGLSAGAKDLKTGIEGSVYTNAEFACRLTAPQSSWSIESAPQKGVQAIVVRFKVPDHDDVLIHFVPINVPAAFTPRALTEIRATRFKTTYKDFEILKDEDYAVQRLKGRILSFQRSGEKSEGKTMKTTEVLWSDGSSCFLLNLIADDRSHDEYAADFFKVLSSFESLREEAQPKKQEN